MSGPGLAMERTACSPSVRVATSIRPPVAWYRVALERRLATSRSMRSGLPVVRAGLNATTRSNSLRLWARSACVRDRCDVDRLVTREPALADGEIEERLDQALLLLAAGDYLLAHRAQRGRVRVRIGERQLHQRELERDRSAELVRDIGDKALPTLERLRGASCGEDRDRGGCRRGVRHAGKSAPVP